MKHAFVGVPPHQRYLQIDFEWVCRLRPPLTMSPVLFRFRVVHRRPLFCPLLPVFVAVGSFLFVTSIGWAQDSDTNPSESVQAPADWQQAGWPLLKKFCLDCHGSDQAEAELDLSAYRSEQVLADSGPALERVLEMIRFGAMPPEDASLPSMEERKQLVTALEQVLHSVACDPRPRAGSVTARRLNRAEYNHSIRDLFGIDLRPADSFPSDEVGAGFDNNGDLLSLSPLLLEKYFEAAELVAAHAIVDPDSLPQANDDRSSERLIVEGDSQTGRFFGRFLAPDAYVWTELSVPRTGEYRVQLFGGNGRRAHTLSTIGLYDQTGLLRGVYKLRYFGGGGSNDRGELKLELSAGEHRFIVCRIPDEQPYEVGVTRFDRIEELTPQRIKQGRQRSKQALEITNDVDEDHYTLMIRRLLVTGPNQPRSDELPPSQKSLIRELPKREKDRWVGVQRPATVNLQPLMRRAFRRPVSEEEVRPYADLVVAATGRGESFYRGMQIALSAVLVSPHFLFRVELPDHPEQQVAGEEVPLTSLQLATRLSYFLWSSLPDESLLSDAEAGQLDRDAIARHVQRMIDDPRAEALSTEFAAQWLGLRNLTGHEADTERFVDFDEELTAAMQRETELLFMHVVRNNLPVGELLTADYSFLNSRLARHYAMEAADTWPEDEFIRRSLTGTPRRGVLSHAAVLTLTSSPTRTSPVMRGKWILENILGTPPPEPPAGVPPLEENQEIAADMTLRQQFELHRSDPTCAACHRVMDQLGFGLESYDAIGRYREKDKSQVIDSSGELPDGRRFNGAAELSQVLAESERIAFAKTATRRLMTFALGRELTPHDECSVDEIIAESQSDDFRFVDLVLGVINSRPFQYYQWNYDE